MLETLFHDLRFGARMLLKNPGFTLITAFTLALGIGGNTAIFTVTDALLLKPLPYHNPQELVGLDIQREGAGVGSSIPFSLRRYKEVREGSRSFAGVAAEVEDIMNLTGHGEPVVAKVARVSPNLFPLLGVNAALGRTFAEEEGNPEGKPVVMISDALWQARFGGDRNIVGQTVNLDSTSYTIIGVVPAGTQCPFIGPVDIWSPRYFELSLLTPERIQGGSGYLRVIARQKPPASMASANAEMEVLNYQYSKENPKAADAGLNRTIVVGNLQEQIVGELRTRLLFLSLAAGVVLLIACANVASLLLSRALTRRREMAVRAALGARRGLLARQLLVESVMLALIAGTFGIVLAFVATKSLSVWAAGNLPQSIPIETDLRVHLFAIAVSIFVGLIFGIMPALQLSRTNMNETLRGEGRSSAGSHRRRVGGALVVIQVALSLVLLIGAGLLLRSFKRLLQVDAGFEPHNVLGMNISLSTVRYADSSRQIAFFDELLRRVSALPGVDSAAISSALPVRPIRVAPVLPEGQPEAPIAERPFVIIETISSKYFETMRIPVLAGRVFTDADNAKAPRTLIINEALAHNFWPNESPLGKRIAVGTFPPAEIVGVTRNVKNRSLALETQPQIYMPFSQLPWAEMNLLARTAAEPHSMISAVRLRITELDSDQPVTEVQTMDEFLDGSRAQPRSTTLLLTIFSAVALVISIVGIYGMMSYSVAQRRAEIGVRMALGADKADILRFVVGQGVGLTATGIAIGLLVALALTRLISAFLYKVTAYDTTTFVLGPLVFIVIGVLASYLPAH
ncbi:MAG: ABC transporter permease, partial [Chloracidobacterium sp.]|nr:ABC transporter permease [Chloracidobacterium sp.]